MTAKRTRTRHLPPVAPETKPPATARTNAVPGSICPRCGYLIASPSHTCPPR
jgi:uncharacterized OB-fold protein